MELHSSFPSARKKLWNILRVAMFIMRKGSVSKRKLIMDMNLMMQRGKVLGKSLGKNLTFFHPNSSAGTPSFGLHEYEFSCANSPNPPTIFFRASSKRKHSYFPCIGASAVDEQPDKAPPGPLAVVLPMINYSPQSRRCSSTALADQRCTPTTTSPFSAARGSNYSLAAEEAGDIGSGGEVDNRAEEFIKRFYQNLHAQGQSTALIQYQEEQYQEMLAKGA